METQNNNTQTNFNQFVGIRTFNKKVAEWGQELGVFAVGTPTEKELKAEDIIKDSNEELSPSEKADIYLSRIARDELRRPIYLKKITNYQLIDSIEELKREGYVFLERDKEKSISYIKKDKIIKLIIEYIDKNWSF